MATCRIFALTFTKYWLRKTMPTVAKVRQKLEQLLGNEAFIEQFCGPDKPAGVYKLNEDPTTGAVVLSHVMGEGAVAAP